MPDPKSILELYYTLEPTKRLANKIVGLEDPVKQLKKLPDAKARTFRIDNKEITQERDYTTGLSFG